MDLNLSWTRRDVLRTFAAATGLPALGLAASPRRRVGIIGGGMAGVSLAWLLDGERDVVLLEARDSIGGDVSQETALVSARQVALGLQVSSARVRALT